MSSPGVIVNPPSPNNLVKPALPNTVPITSPAGNPTSASAVVPSVPSAAPPNVNGGTADFSGLTGTIQDMLKAKQASISSSIDALKANQSVDAQTTAALAGINTETLQAYHNIENIQQLPGGAGGKLATIISLFDSDYNPNLQQTRIQGNNIRGQQITATAGAIKEQNNALPAIMDKITDAATSAFNAQKDANQLAIQYGGLQNDVAKTNLDRARLGIEMSAERRQEVEFAVNSMSTTQIQQQFALAQKGQGQFKDAGGLLEHRLVQEQAAEVSLHSAQTAAANGDRDAYNSNATDFVSHLPPDIITAYLNKAQKAGQSVVTFNTGNGPDGKPTSVAIPIPIVQQGLVKNAQIEQQANATVAADETQRLNLIPNATALVGGANAFASIDPRATSIVTNATGILQGLDPKNPNSVRQTATMIDAQKAQLNDIAKEVSSKFSSPEAKAAIVSYGSSGTFDPTGGTAVVADSIGIPALNTQTLYRGAFTQLNTLLATAVQQQNITGTSGFDPNKAGDAQAMLAQLLQKPNGKETIGRLSNEILANPANQKLVAGQISGIIRSKSVNDTLNGLAHQANANPIWQDIYQHPDQFMSYAKDGSGATTQNLVVNYQKLFETLEKHTIQTGGKVNYSSAFINAMRSYAINADNAPASDPRYTVYDHALEAAIYGNRPHSAVLGDFIGALATQASRAHADMQNRIQQDLSGATQRQASDQDNATDIAAGGFGMGGVVIPRSTRMTEKERIELMAKIPSATGTGLTADQIKQMYGGGQ